jgi:hypothetical protein
VTIAPEGSSLLKQEGADHALGPNYVSFGKSNFRLESKKPTSPKDAALSAMGHEG